MRYFAIFTLLGGVALTAIGCSSGGPVSPRAVNSPDTPVVIDPRLASYVGIPGGDQQLGWTENGHLRCNFPLQNQTDEPLRVRITASFFDDSGIQVVDEQRARRIFIPPHGIENVSVVCANADGKKVKVQVGPAY